MPELRHPFRWQNESWEAWKHGVLWHPESACLFLADLHLGKTQHFRKEGIAMPPEAGNRDFQLLETILKGSKPQKVFFLGDLFHSVANSAVLLLKNLLSNHQNTHFVLIRGNHDLLPSTSYNALGINVEAEGFLWKKFRLGHDPTHLSKPHLAGHVHPGVRFHGPGKQQLTLPAFWIRPNQIVLPAFGSLTGLAKCQPEKKDRLIVWAGNQLWPFSGPEALD